MRTKNNGIGLELEYGHYLHQHNLPLLVSPLVLRKRGAGQIDIAYIKDDIVYICEVKSHLLPVAIEQKNRIFCSALFIKTLLSLPVKIRLLRSYNLPKL